MIALAGAAALAGCTTTVERSDDPEPVDLLEAAIDRRVGMDSLSGRRRLEATGDGEPFERVERLAERPPAARRVEVLEATNATVSPGEVSVTTRPVSWEYDPEANEVTERHHPHRVFADRTRLVLERLRDRDDLAYAGTDAVAGRDVHLLEAAPPPDADVERSIDVVVGGTTYVIPLEAVSPEELDDAEVRRTIAIAADDPYPVRERDVVVADGTELHALTATVEELTIDGGFDDDPFDYEPPADADATVTGLEPEGIYDSPSAATETAPYALPEPELPDPFELDRVTVVEKLNHTTTTLWYLDPDDPERELYVSIRDEPRFDEDALEPVEINGHEGYLRDGRILSAFWNCGGLSYEVSSPDVEADVVEIAETIDCE